MSTQILHIETYDDLHSVKDKISLSGSQHLLLVWPLRGKTIADKLELSLILRHSAAMHIQIALVTPPRKIAQAAKDLNIPVFPSIRIAQRTPWENLPQDLPAPPPGHTALRSWKILRGLVRKPAHPNPSPPAARASTFLAGVFAFLLLLLAIIPSAEISLQPNTVAQILQMDISAHPSIHNFNLNGSLPAQILTITVEGRDQINTSGSIAVPITPAVGTVTFTNLTDQAITIPAGTVIHTIDPDGIRFETTEEAALIAEVGAEVSAAVKALQPGEAGNLPAHSLVLVDGALGLNVIVSNLEPTSGGSQQTNAAPDPADYDNLKSQLLAALWENAQQEALSAQYPAALVLSDSPRSTIILREEFTPKEPQPASELTLLLQVEYELAVVSKSDLENMAAAVLDATLPSGYSVQAGTLSISQLSQPETDAQERTTWKALLQREIYPDITSEIVANLVKGKYLGKAGVVLEDLLSLESLPEISVFPAWWPVMPLLPQRISVTADR